MYSRMHRRDKIATVNKRRVRPPTKRVWDIERERKIFRVVARSVLSLTSLKISYHIIEKF